MKYDSESEYGDFIGGEQHPGRLIRNVLRRKGIPQNALAARMNINPAILSQIISGKRKINPLVAIYLEICLQDIKAIEWLRLQNAFDLKKLYSKLDIALDITIEDLKLHRKKP